MTRPRKRPEGGRYYVVVGVDGMARDVCNTGRNLIGLTLPDERIVECVAMPKVLVTADDGSPSVRVNGVCVRSFHDLRLARSWATNLRRALRGK